MMKWNDDINGPKGEFSENQPPDSSLHAPEKGEAAEKGVELVEEPPNEEPSPSLKPIPSLPDFRWNLIVESIEEFIEEQRLLREQKEREAEQTKGEKEADVEQLENKKQVVDKRGGKTKKKRPFPSSPTLSSPVLSPSDTDDSDPEWKWRKRYGSDLDIEEPEWRYEYSQYKKWRKLNPDYKSEELDEEDEVFKLLNQSDYDLDDSFFD